MRLDLKNTWPFLKEVFNAYLESKTPRLGASLAYYTIFAIAPLFIIAISVAGFWFGQEEAKRDLINQITKLVGKEGAQAVQTMISAANQPKTSLWASIAAVVTLFIGASAVFVELKDALNTIWRVKEKAGGGLWCFVKNRLLSFAMVLGVGFVLLVSLVLNAVLSGIGNFASTTLPTEHYVWVTVNSLASLAVITLLFAMIFKVLPDVKIAWSDVWIGAFVTALLFNFGKFLIGFYLGRSSTVSIYGAAGSFIILLLWVYYSAQILFFGAEFTRIYAKKRAAQAGSAKDASHASGKIC